MKKLILFWLFWSSLWINLYAQNLPIEVISSGGDFFRNANLGTIHWTLGEPITETVNGNLFRITQGFNQVFYYVLTDVTTVTTSDFKLNIYPNPTTEKVIVATDKLSAFTVEVRNLTGQLLQRAITDDNQIELNLGDYPAGVYLFTIIPPDLAAQTFKVQKLQF